MRRGEGKRERMGRRTLAWCVVDSHDLVVFVEDDAGDARLAVASGEGVRGIVVHQTVKGSALLPARRRHTESYQQKSE
jgi:hypothetical protein